MIVKLINNTLIRKSLIHIFKVTEPRTVVVKIVNIHEVINPLINVTISKLTLSRACLIIRKVPLFYLKLVVIIKMIINELPIFIPRDPPGIHPIKDRWVGINKLS